MPLETSEYLQYSSASRVTARSKSRLKSAEARFETASMYGDDLLTTLPRCGTRTARQCAALGITTIRDLLLYFPLRHEDRSQVKRIADVRIGELATVEGTITAIQNRRYMLPPLTTEYYIGILTKEQMDKLLENPSLVGKNEANTKIALAKLQEALKEREGEGESESI